MGSCCGKEAANDNVTEPIIPHQDDQPMICKVVCIGDRFVGKSSMVLRYTQDDFNENYSVTIGAAFATKTLQLKVGDDQIVNLNLHIWDTAGEEQYRSMTRFFYREALVGIVTYDATNAEVETIKNLKSWIGDLINQSPDAVVFIVGNKIDGMVVVDSEEIKKFAAENGYYFAECSAKTGENIRSLFEEVACVAYQQKIGDNKKAVVVSTLH